MPAIFIIAKYTIAYLLVSIVEIIIGKPFDFESTDWNACKVCFTELRRGGDIEASYGTMRTTLLTRPKVRHTHVICQALKNLLSKTPDNFCVQHFWEQFLVETVSETSAGAYVGRKLCAKKG